MSNYVNVKPAYGRDYTNQAAVKKDWKDGKDFIVTDFLSPYYGRYINVEDAKREGVKVIVRYAREQKVVQVL